MKGYNFARKLVTNKLNSKTGYVISGTGVRHCFNLDIFYNAVKFLMVKFSIKEHSAISQLFYFLFCLRLNNLNYNKRYNDIALKNIVELDYEWSELFI